MAALSLAFDILARDRGASRTLNNVGDSAERAGKKGRGFGTAMKAGMGLAVGAVAAAGLGTMFVGFIKEAGEAAKIGRLTDAVLKSTGGAAGVTATQVGALADALSKKAGVDDELIQSGANVLLTFTKVRNEAGKGNDIFNQGTQAALNLSAAMGTDLQAANILVGKALNDPIKGMGALSKAGIQFTAEQKEQIKVLVESGDVMGAQKIILGEFTTQFGGAAEAAASPMAKLKVAAENIGESIGGLLLPVVERLATWLSEKVVPAVEDFIQGFKDGEGPGGKFRDILTAVKDAAAIAFDYFKSDVLPRLKDFAGFIKDEVLPRLKELGEFIKDEVVPPLQDFAGWLVDHVQPAIEALGDWIKDHKEELIALGAGVAAGAIAFGALAAAVAIYNGVLAIAAGAQIALNIAMSLNPIGIVVLAIAALVAAFVLAYQKSDTFRAIVDKTWDVIATGATWLWDNVLKPSFTWLIDTLKKAWENFQTFQAIIKLVWDKVKELVGNGIRAVVDFFLGMAENILGAADTAFGWIPGLGDKLDEAKRQFQIFRDGVNIALGGIKDRTVSIQADAVLKASRGVRVAFAEGGPIRGPGSGTSDSVPIWGSNGEHVWTAREVASAGGHGAVEAMRSSVLRGFAKGGPVQFDIRTQTDTTAIAAAAKAFDDRFARAVAEAVAGLGSGPGGAGSSSKLVAFGRMLQGRGFRVSEHPSFGGVDPVHTKGSKHYVGRAIDVNWAAGTSLAEQRAIDAIVPLARQYGLRTIWRAPGHFNHAHFDYHQGGLMMPGQSGTNSGSSPERVLTGAQTAAFDRLVDLLERQGAGGVQTIVLEVDGRRMAQVVSDHQGTRIQQEAWT